MEAIEAAQGYYRKHKRLIDARLALNEDEAGEMSTGDPLNEYIDDSVGVAEARLKQYGVSVWVIVGYLKGPLGSVEHVATGFRMPEEAIKAAEVYYRRHKRLIDARLAMNEV